jgi:hypothetical protein
MPTKEKNHTTAHDTAPLQKTADTKDLADKALKQALKVSRYRKKEAVSKDVYSDAIEAEIELIYAAIDKGMPALDRERANITIKRLMSTGRRYSYSRTTQIQ